MVDADVGKLHRGGREQRLSGSSAADEGDDEIALTQWTRESVCRSDTVDENGRELALV